MAKESRIVAPRVEARYECEKCESDARLPFVVYVQHLDNNHPEHSPRR